MWQKLPVWLRAILSGLAVSGVPTFAWALLATVNFRLTPRIPWSVPLMVPLLWAWWRYVGGEGPPRRLSDLRRERRRAVTLSSRSGPLALLGGGLAVGAIWAAFGALRGLLHIARPADGITQFPVWTIFAAVLMGSAVAGVAEEAGFRGYMQLPLERAYGPAVAVMVTSILFTLVHLTKGARILPFLPFYFAVAIVYGTLTLLTGSIYPSMILHFLGDVLMFTFQYLNLRYGAAGGAGNGRIEPLAAALSLGLAVAAILVIRLLARERAAIEPAAAEPAMSQ